MKPSLNLYLVLILLLAGAAPATAVSPDFQVLHFETLQQPNFETLSPTTGHARLSFQAAGRDWQVLLRPNARLAGQAGGPDSAAFEGHLAGAEGSWARVTRIDGVLWGMLHDGRDLWVIEPLSDLANHGATTAGEVGTAIYRMADTLVDPTAMSCATPRSPLAPQRLRGDLAMAMLGGELARVARSTADGVFATTPLSIVADAEFRTLALNAGRQPEDEVLIRMNNADGIYRQQVGVNFQLRNIRILDSTPALLSADEPGELLDGFKDYLAADRELRRGVALSHLLTGRRFTSGDDGNGQTLGIAFLSSGQGTGVLCSPGADRGSFAWEFGSALTAVRRQRNVALDTLVIAHEIGHNFGAVHDGEEPPCEDTPDSGFIMATRLGVGVTEFSACSLDTMLPFAERALAAGCLLDASFAELAVVLPVTSVSVQVGTPFTLGIDVRNSGTAVLESVQLETLVPAGLTVTSADTGGAACTVEGTLIRCELGALDVEAGRRIEHRLRATTAGNYRVDFSASAAAAPADAAASATVVAQAPPPPPEGGGGSPGAPLVLLLTLALALERFARLSRRWPRGGRPRPQRS